MWSSVKADVLACGNAQAILVDAESANDPYFTLTISNKTLHKTFKLSIQEDFVHLTCDNKADGTVVFLLNHTCGGSGCTDHNYGIIDVETGDMVLKPADRYKGNKIKAEQIMGRELQPMNWREHNSDIYMRSKIELG